MALSTSFLANLQYLIYDIKRNACLELDIHAETIKKNVCCNIDAKANLLLLLFQAELIGNSKVKGSGSSETSNLPSSSTELEKTDDGETTLSDVTIEHAKLESDSETDIHINEDRNSEASEPIVKKRDYEDSTVLQYSIVKKQKTHSDVIIKAAEDQGNYLLQSAVDHATNFEIEDALRQITSLVTYSSADESQEETEQQAKAANSNWKKTLDDTWSSNLKLDISHLLKSKYYEEGDDQGQTEENGKQVGVKNTRFLTDTLYCLVSSCRKKFFTNKEDLDAHLLQDHNILKFRCLLLGCTKSFGSNTQLTKHFRVAHGAVTEWKCGLCNSAQKDHSALSRHMYSNHFEGKFICSAEDCLFHGLTRQSVINHFTSTHQVFVCSFAGCKKTTRQKVDLVKHERTHRGTKPYKCAWPGCTSASTERSQILAHIRSVHFGMAKLKKDREEQEETRNPHEFLQIDNQLL